MTDQALPQHHHSVVALYQHVPHPGVGRHRGEKPIKTNDQRVGFNGRVGLLITTIVGTMWCAYVFSGLAFVSLKPAIQTHDLVTIVAWISQTFLQLVLLPIIIVGQNIQGRAADKRAEQTYNDAEAIMHECLELQQHLQAQDKVLDDMFMHLQKHLPATQ